MIDYGLGQPGNEKPNYHALLFGWTLFISKRTLGHEHKEIFDQYQNQLKNKNKFERKIITFQYRELVFTKARQAFYWESILGMCPICTHFWFTLIIFIFFFQGNMFNLAFYFLVSHLIIRILKKWI